MNRKTVEIVEVEDSKDAAELCYEVDGVFMTMAEHSKLIEARYRRRHIIEWVFIAPFFLALIFLYAWIAKG